MENTLNDLRRKFEGWLSYQLDCEIVESKKHMGKEMALSIQQQEIGIKIQMYLSCAEDKILLMISESGLDNW